jgi:hypothetical protein
MGVLRDVNNLFEEKGMENTQNISRRGLKEWRGVG